MASTVLTPLQGIAHYLNDIALTHPDDGRTLIAPALFATVFFEGGAKPAVRQGLLDCFDAFESQFGEHLKGGRLIRSKYSAKTSKGVQAMRQHIAQTKLHEAVEFVRSSVTDQYTAPEYAIEALTKPEFAGGVDGGFLSYVKFILPHCCPVKIPTKSTA